MDPREAELKNVFRNAGLELSAEQARSFVRYAEMLEDWNRRMNLTAINDFQEVVRKHFLDSCAPLFASRNTLNGSLLDVGSGAGFPGIPLKIMLPELKLVMLDSLKKRIGFLEAVTLELGLKEVKAVHGRAEDLARNEEYREQFDTVTARAVAPLPVLAEYCIPFVKSHGRFLAYKSGNVAQELKEAEKAFSVLGAGRAGTENFVLPGTDMERSLIWAEKIRKTPAFYPRKAGTVKKNPLGGKLTGEK